MAFGTAYNDLFLVYVTLMSASLFGLILTLMSFDLAMLTAHFSDRLLHQDMGIHSIVSGIVLLLIWLGYNIERSTSSLPQPRIEISH
jgi:uncharacterized membrane protein YGL010W